MATKKDAVLAVVPDRSHDNALVGSIPELVQAFDQIGANMALLGLNGWKNVQHCKAACWLAHGAHMHPAVFIQNHYCMEIQGKLLVEPKWEFVVAVLQSRVPGFKFEVLVEADDCAKVRMSDASGNTHTVEYTVADAKRQGLFSRTGGNMWTAGSTREGCLKQAIKRCGRRIGAAALLDLPMGLDGYEAPDGVAAHEPSVADVIDEVIAKGVGDGVTDDTPGKAVAGAPSRERTGLEPEQDGTAARTESDTAPVTKPSPKSDDTPRGRLYARITKMYGSVSKPIALEKASFLYNAMMEETTGVNPKHAFTKPGHIGPVEAEQIIAWLDARDASKKAAGNADQSEPSGVTDDPPAVDVESVATVVDDDAPPEPEKAAPAVDEIGRTAERAFDELYETVARARKLFAPRQFIKEAPPATGKFWFVDEATFLQAGHQASIKLQVGPDVVAEQRVIEQLNEILSAACDDRERSGR